MQPVSGPELYPDTETSANSPLSRSKLEARGLLGRRWELLDRLTTMGVLTRAGTQRQSRYPLAVHQLHKSLLRYFSGFKGCAPLILCRHIVRHSCSWTCS